MRKTNISCSGLVLKGYQILIFSKMNDQEKAERRKKWLEAVNRAKQVLKKGDRIRLTKCPGTKRTITFDSWDGNWIVSKSGGNDYSAMSIDMLNGKPHSFCNVGS